MELNADFTKRAVVHWGDARWQAAPTPGVWRRMLDRIGGEVARATTIVKYEAGSQFPPHVHGGGEEFLVLNGVFQDELGDYPAGSYIRNPPGSRHAPRSEEGCTIFVKLWQFSHGDRAHFRTRVDLAAPSPEMGRPGVSITPLVSQPDEWVRVEHWAAHADIWVEADGGAELLVLDGTFSESGEAFARLSWLRLPDGDGIAVRTGADGARVWIKSGHLRQPTVLLGTVAGEMARAPV